jgi:hypothetical protein
MECQAFCVDGAGVAEGFILELGAGAYHGVRVDNGSVNKHV